MTPAAWEARVEPAVEQEAAEGGSSGDSPTARTSAMTEAALFRAYGADREPELCMADECDHARTDHDDAGCFECPCRGFDAQGPPDPYDVARDQRLTDRAEGRL